MAIQIYHKENGRDRYEPEEYIDFLCELLEKDHMVFDRIECSYLDYWAYPKSRTISRKEDIREALTDDLLTEAEAFFSDADKNYRFRYAYRHDSRLELEIDEKEFSKE